MLLWQYRIDNLFIKETKVHISVYTCMFSLWLFLQFEIDADDDEDLVISSHSIGDCHNQLITMINRSRLVFSSEDWFLNVIQLVIHKYFSLRIIYITLCQGQLGLILNSLVLISGFTIFWVYILRFESSQFSRFGFRALISLYFGS